ncbi:hypothetical protein BKA70DRAFT_1428228 [Coprinopsis sp. MPI-PUGE-AT-0042]|nr:hypothetical protein BKA70DRAFT_1428228 [Coprinopsis sp. MPI-PUGE-AT-0042]
MASSRQPWISSADVVDSLATSPIPNSAEQDLRRHPPNRPKPSRDIKNVLQTSLAWFETMPLEEYHGLTMYLSSRLRAAGHATAKTLFTLYWGLAKFRFGASLPIPDCLSKLARLMVEEGTGDPMLISAVCANDPHVPDRIIGFYYNCWWSPFDISKNWDGKEETIIKIYRLQARNMPPSPTPAHPSRAMLDLDTTETLKEMTRTMMLINRLKGLLAQVKAEEAAQAELFAAASVAGATGLSAEAVAELLHEARLIPTA